MVKRQTTIEAVPKPRVGDAAWRGLTAGQRKAQAEKALREMEQERSPEQIRQAKREALEREIAQAEHEEVQAFGAGLEPKIRSGIAEYVLAQRVVSPRFSTAMTEFGRVVEAAVEAEKSVRRVRDTLARQVEASLALRLERESAGRTPGQVLELQRNLLLEGNGQFRRRWSELVRETEAKPLLDGLEPGDDEVARALLLAVQTAVTKQLGGRPEPFSSRGRTYPLP